MIISARQVRAYIGQSYHEPIPYPTNWLIPENSDPSKYDGIPESLTVACPHCKKMLLLGNPSNVDNSANFQVTCPVCKGRFSHSVRDKSWSNYAMTPGLLDMGMGSNTNNAAQGVEYHPGANSNQDTFSSNLGK